MKPIFECGHDAKIAAATPKAPEEVGVFGRTGPQDLSLGCHHFGGNQVVAGQSVFSSELAEAAAKREPGDTSVAVDAHGGRQAVLLCRPVELAQIEAGLRAGDPADRIDLDPLHVRQVDDHAAVADRQAGDIVTAATDRDADAMGSCERDGPSDVLGTGTIGDHRRPLVDGAIPDLARLVVIDAPFEDHVALEPQLRGEPRFGVRFGHQVVVRLPLLHPICSSPRMPRPSSHGAPDRFLNPIRKSCKFRRKWCL